MSIHSSLRTGSGLSKHRNVLTRMERLKLLEEEGRWKEAKNSVLGLPKVKSIKPKAKKKAKKEEAAEGAAAGAAAPAAAAAPTAAKPAAKPAK